MSRRRRESPIKRTNPSGKERWVARYTKRDGTYGYAGTFDRKHEAQTAIDATYDAEQRGTEAAEPAVMFGDYAKSWTEKRPRGVRTNVTNASRARAVLDVEIEGVCLRDWPFRLLRRRHAQALVHELLTVQGRSAGGAQNVLRTLSAMAEDAITDEAADVNWVRGVRVSANDPRVTKPAREPRVLTFAAMREFARHAGPHEAAVRCLSDCGLRLGEMLGLERDDLDGDRLRVRGTAHNGRFVPGDRPTKRHVRTVPVPPSLLELLAAAPTRIHTRLLFPTPEGRLWWERNFYRDVWHRAQEAWAGVDPQLTPAERRRFVAEAGKDCTPHDFRHSWVSHLRAAGIDPADLAEIGGHSVETATARYTHALGRSDNAVRTAVG